MIFESALVELFIVEGAEFRRLATQSLDQTELRGDNVDNQPKPRLPRKFKPVLGFSLHLASGSPVARRFVFKLLQLYAAKVRSPVLFAVSKARRTRARPVCMCFVQGMTRFPKDM